MKEEDLYNALQGLMPTLQFVDPYIDDAPPPPPNKNWVQMNIINILDKGRSQEREVSFNEETGQVLVAYDQTRIYTIQFDFYGKNALDNCNTAKQTLQINLDRLSHIGESQIGLLKMGITRNLTELLGDKRYLKRYSFDLDLMVIDTVEFNRNYITSANIKLNHYCQ